MQHVAARSIVEDCIRINRRVAQELRKLADKLDCGDASVSHVSGRTDPAYQVETQGFGMKCVGPYTHTLNIEYITRSGE